MSEYSITLDYKTITDGEVDGGNMTHDESDDLSVHLIKQEVFAKHLTAALYAITKELTEIGLDDVAGSRGK